MIVLLGMVACTDGEDAAPPLLDTGWFDPTTSVSGPACEERILSWVPATGTSDWYWRDAPEGTVALPDPTAYRIWLEDAIGATVPATLAWSADATSFALVPDAPLAPVSSYDLVLTDCASIRHVAFSTSAFGLPIEGGNGSLVDHTWVLDLEGATWEQPLGLGALFALYVDDPILLGVLYADALHIDLLAALAVVSDLGEVSQDPERDPWEFPTADFSGAPYFDAAAELVELVVPDPGGGDIAVPVEDFRLEGTFSADGSVIGGGRLTGLADTRGLGALFGSDGDPDAACEEATTLGAVCVPCGSDGGEYCLGIEATGIDGALLPGLVLDPTPSS